MTTARAFVDLAISQDGDRYVFGVEVSPSDTNPAAFDCSELVQWCAARLGVKPTVPDGSWYQLRHCRDHGTLVPIRKAIETPGALLFRFIGDPFSGGRPRAAHVAISQGNGKTIEARSSSHGTGQFSTEGRGWTHAGLIPGITYDEEEAIPTPPKGDEVRPTEWTDADRRVVGDIVLAYGLGAEFGGSVGSPNRKTLSQHIMDIKTILGAIDTDGVSEEELAQHVQSLLSGIPPRVVAAIKAAL